MANSSSAARAQAASHVVLVIQIIACLQVRGYRTPVLSDDWQMVWRWVALISMHNVAAAMV
jgi:hypothetical protein